MRRKTKNIDWSVYVLLDPAKLVSNTTPVAFCKQLFEAGLDILQLRDKNSAAREIYQLGCKIAALADEFDTTFILNDRPDIALACGADGLHLGPEDIPIEAARRITPSDFIIGGSAGSSDRATNLANAGADYLGCGAVYEARQSKTDASAPKGPTFINSVTQKVDIPVVGIGGITARNAEDVVRAGADGVAVIREIVSSEKPVESFQKLRASVTSS